jgi:hypothetical protein
MTPVKWIVPEELIEQYPRNARRRGEADTFTRLLSCKPLDVELRRLLKAELRKQRGLKNKRAK